MPWLLFQSITPIVKHKVLMVGTLEQLYNKQYSNKTQSSTLNSPCKPCKFVEGQLTSSFAFPSVMPPSFIIPYAIPPLIPPPTIRATGTDCRIKKTQMIKAKKHMHLLLLTCNLLLLLQWLLLLPMLLPLLLQMGQLYSILFPLLQHKLVSQEHLHHRNLSVSACPKLRYNENSTKSSSESVLHE